MLYVRSRISWMSRISSTLEPRSLALRQAEWSTLSTNESAMLRMFCREDMSVTVWNHLGKRSVLYLFNIRRQEVALLALARSPANLSDQLVELLLAEDVIAFGVVVVGRDASHGRLVHHAAERARSLRHGRSPRADSASQGHALGNGRGLLGELLGDRHLGLDACL